MPKLTADVKQAQRNVVSALFKDAVDATEDWDTLHDLLLSAANLVADWLPQALDKTRCSDGLMELTIELQVLR